MKYRFQSGGRVYEVDVERSGAGYRVLVDGQLHELEVLDSQPGELSVLLAGKPVTLYWANDGSRKWISAEGCSYLLEKPAPGRGRRLGEVAAEDSVRAPMPAQVRLVQVAEGDPVEKGQTLLLLEAMKMEIRVKSPRRGKVKRLLAQEGQTVERDAVLVELAD